MSADLHCNDVHSKLNPTTVARIVRPVNEGEVAAAMADAAREGLAVSICGARHAMGGQQFGEGTMLLDLSGAKTIGEVDRERGEVEAGAGVTWPELVKALHQQQEGAEIVWSIRQKQTGADDLTLGGSLGANAHGRGLVMKPIVDDVEAITLVKADGEVVRCSRSRNGELFGLAIGGYGCFGVVVSIRLRLAPRVKLERVVEVTTLDSLMPALEKLIAAGHLYGDFQFSIDELSPDFLFRGVLSSYRPISSDAAMPAERKELDRNDWKELIWLAHTDRAKVFDVYSRFYLSTHGERYWSDTHQLGVYLDHYHEDLDRELGTSVPATEMITELYVPRDRLTAFMASASAELRARDVPVIYGTVRLIEREDVTFLAWAREDYACVVFNLHTEHTEEGIATASAAFRILIDMALSHGGSFFLTYHKWAERSQIERAYPQFGEFLARKEAHDPERRLQSNWWRHYEDLFKG